MQQIAKQFSERLNQCLDDVGMPANARERAALLSKMLDIPKQQAWNLLEGHIVPDNELLQKIAAELEINPNVLIEKK